MAQMPLTGMRCSQLMKPPSLMRKKYAISLMQVSTSSVSSVLYMPRMESPKPRAYEFFYFRSSVESRQIALGAPNEMKLCTGQMMARSSIPYRADIALRLRRDRGRDSRRTRPHPAHEIKRDISTFSTRGHFYFALIRSRQIRIIACRRIVCQSYNHIEKSRMDLLRLQSV